MASKIIPTKTDMSKYPFLPQVKEYVARLGIDLTEVSELPKIRNRAKERVTATFDLETHFRQEPNAESEVEIASFPVAVLMVGGTGERMLAERFALFESKQISGYLEKEKTETILYIAKSFKWDIETTNDAAYPYSIHFTNYLKNTARGKLVHDAKWRLVNRQLDKGRVYLTKSEACRLLQEEIRAYVEQRTKQELGKIPASIQDDINEIKVKFAENRPQLEQFDQIVIAEESQYPPCVKNLFERATKGQHLSHTERFTLVTYLAHQKINVDAIVKLFSNVTDFKEDLTRYQVEHLAGERGSRTAYTTYNCATLKTHGICTNPNDPICNRIRNPLTYHLRKPKATSKSIEKKIP